jgi:hypothetical protein
MAVHQKSIVPPRGEDNLSAREERQTVESIDDRTFSATYFCSDSTSKSLRLLSDAAVPRYIRPTSYNGAQKHWPSRASNGLSS